MFKSSNLRALITAFAEILILVIIIVSCEHFLSRKRELAQEELAAVEQELESAHSLIEKVPNPEKKIAELKTKQDELDERSVSKKELPKIIQELVDKSTELQVEVVSIRPRDDIPLQERNLPRGVTKAYVEMVIKCSYDTLGEYLKGLNDLSVIFTIEKMFIEKIEEFAETTAKKGKDKGELFTTLVLSTYTLVRY